MVLMGLDFIGYGFVGFPMVVPWWQWLGLFGFYGVLMWVLMGFDVGFVGFRFFMVVPWRWCRGGAAIMVRFELVWFFVFCFLFFFFFFFLWVLLALGLLGF